MIRKLNLNPPQQEVLEHAYRYRLLLPELLPDHRFAVEELTRRKILAKAPLYAARHYWYLTAKARRFLAVEHFRPGPLSESEKIHEFAMICLCLFDPQTERIRLTPADFSCDLTGQHPRQLSRYYLQQCPGQPDRVGYLRVDHGGRGRWDRLALRIHRDIQRHEQHPTYRGLLDEGRFELAVVTATQEKAARVEQALRQHAQLARAAVCLHVIPELLLLIAPPPLDVPLCMLTPQQRV